MKKGIDYTGVTVVFLCHDGAGNILMGKRGVNCRDEHGRWDIGAGGLEHGDDVIARLRTEIKEEYCTEVLEHSFLGYRNVHREHDGKKTHWVALDFLVRVNKELVANGEPHKIDAVEWFQLDTLPEELHSEIPRFLQKYAEELQQLNPKL